MSQANSTYIIHYPVLLETLKKLIYSLLVDQITWLLTQSFEILILRLNLQRYQFEVFNGCINFKSIFFF